MCNWDSVFVLASHPLPSLPLSPSLFKYFIQFKRKIISTILHTSAIYIFKVSLLYAPITFSVCNSMNVKPNLSIKPPDPPCFVSVNAGQEIQFSSQLTHAQVVYNISRFWRRLLLQEPILPLVMLV